MDMLDILGSIENKHISNESLKLEFEKILSDNGSQDISVSDKDVMWKNMIRKKSEKDAQFVFQAYTEKLESVELFGEEI